MDELLGGDLENMMFNMRRLMLDNKHHIKKYNHYRKVHADILESMASYIFDGKYDFGKYISELNKDREVSSVENLKGFGLSSDNPDDVSMSIFSKVDDDNPIYMYNRVITVDGISFGTGIHCNLSYKNKEFRKFLKEHDYNESTDFFRCLTLYEISKKTKDKGVRYNTQF